MSDSKETAVLRIVDANANRASEGLRVVEDYARFVLDDAHLTRLGKELRHDLTSTLDTFGSTKRNSARQTQQDVGTELATAEEYTRPDEFAVLTANLKRVQQSLRCLEEFTKTTQPEVARRIEPLRYRMYTLEKAITVTRASCDALAGCSLYVLIDGAESLDDFDRRVSALIDGGVHILQLRDKSLSDRQLLQRARLLREKTSNSGALFVMNDRPDLAVLARADSVHVGQEELSVKDTRTIVGPEVLIGASTHSIEQARQAVLDGANYIGVGPVFPSKTKQFDDFPGVGFLRQVAKEISLPAFAIGGITLANVGEVTATGIKRIAVSQALANSSTSASVAAQLVTSLESG